MKTLIGIILALLICSGIAIIAGTIIALAIFSLIPKDEFKLTLEEDDDDE